MKIQFFQILTFLSATPNFCPNKALYYFQVLFPIFSVHFAGTESATIWRGLIDGAIQSGQRAAIEILQKVDPDYYHPVLEYKDVFLPGTERAYELPYYVLNGLIVCAGALVISCVAWGVHSRVISFNGINERLIRKL